MTKKNGFTLIEFIVVLMIVSLATIVIYVYYNKTSIKTSVQNQNIYLKQIKQGINDVFISSNNLALINSENLIKTKIIPPAMIKSANLVKNLWGGEVEFKNISSTSFGIVLKSVPQEVCGLLANTDFANNSKQVMVNDTAIKLADTVSNQDSVALAINSCGTNNSIEFRNDLEQLIDSVPINTGSGRGKQDPYHIPTTGAYVGSPPDSCGAGSSWNGSFCKCPDDSEWNGAQCVVYNSKPGACRLGHGWNGTDCVPHGISSPGGIYIGDRNVPNVGYSAEQVQQVNPGQSCATSTGYYNNMNCQTCANGAWNGFRCVN